MKKFILISAAILLSTFVFSQTIYTFTGNGNWTVASNWSNNIIPPATLPDGSTINISPAVGVGDTCILNTAQTISPGASLNISAGANFIISGDLSMVSSDSPGIIIGTQVWMSKNLDVSTYRNGDLVRQVTDPVEWSTLTTGAWSWYDNDSVKYAAIYGKLYNWYAVNDPRGLAPVGWHIPSDSEWTILSTFLGGDAIAGGKMKSTSPLWEPPNAAATNSSGFNALPAGYHDYTGDFYSMGDACYWWSSSQASNPAIYSLYRYVYYNTAKVYRAAGGRENGISVRCVKD